MFKSRLYVISCYTKWIVVEYFIGNINRCFNLTDDVKCCVHLPIRVLVMHIFILKGNEWRQQCGLFYLDVLLIIFRH